ncbi:MAG: hypothetical protein H7A23_03310 [Leptospiraceae bacterium]|nr:hypothetical protein [Leptospiraceae bacterium]MCP5493558.1 hypothetical protein [Leptospiraceae bacterium]
MKAKSTVFIFVLIILLLKPQSICAKSDDDYGWILRRIGLTTIELGLFVNYFKYRNTSLHTNEKVASLSIFVFKSDLKATDTQLFTMYYQSAKLSYPTNTIRHSLYDGKTIATGDRSSLKSYRRHLVNSSGAWLGSVVVWDLVTSSNIWGEKYSHSTPVTRAIRSFLLPGWGQKHTGHDLKSAFFFLASVGLAGTSIPPVNRFQKAKLNYRNSNYDFIISSIFINDQSLQRPLYVYQNKERRKDVNRARISSIQNITALGALWLINILDAAIFENVGNEYTSHLTLRPEFNFGSVNMGKNVFPEFIYGMNLTYRF